VCKFNIAEVEAWWIGQPLRQTKAHSEEKSAAKVVRRCFRIHDIARFSTKLGDKKQFLVGTLKRIFRRDNKMQNIYRKGSGCCLMS
jgi:hypothetical protein